MKRSSGILRVLQRATPSKGKQRGGGRFAVCLLLAAVVAALVSPLPTSASDDGDDAGPLAGFTLVDASDQGVVATLSEGLSVELADPAGGSYGIRADLAAGETVGSVSLALSGPKSVSAKTENLVPYSLYGDYRHSGVRRLHGQALPAGTYTVTAVAYAGRRLGGNQLGALEVSFTITKANSAPGTGVEDPDGNRDDAVSPSAQSTPPGAPRNLLAAATHDSVLLLWQAPDDDSVTGYQVLRREVGADPPQELAVLVDDTGSTDTQYTDSSVSADTVYEYQVKAINSAGAGEGSDTRQATTPSDPDQQDDLPIARQSATELWTATLTVARSGQLGCFDNGSPRSSSDCSNRSVLSDNTFTYDGTTYTIKSLYTAAIDRLYLYVDQDLADDMNRLVLEVDGEALPFWSARLPLRHAPTPTDPYRYILDKTAHKFLDTSISWTEGQQVNLRIVHDRGTTPTINPVRNFRATGGAGTVTLRWETPEDLGKMMRECGSRGDLYYQIYYGDASDNFERRVDSMNTIRLTLTSLAAGTWNFEIEPTCEIGSQTFGLSVILHPGTIRGVVVT